MEKISKACALRPIDSPNFTVNCSSSAEPFRSSALVSLREDKNGCFRAFFASVCTPFVWLYQLITRYCCSKDATDVQEVAKKRRSELIHSIDETIESFQSKQKELGDSEFEAWWKGAFEGLDPELQELLYEADMTERGNDDERQAELFVKELSRVIGTNGEVIDPLRIVPNYLEAVRAGL